MRQNAGCELVSECTLLGTSHRRRLCSSGPVAGTSLYWQTGDDHEPLGHGGPPQSPDREQKGPQRERKNLKGVSARTQDLKQSWNKNNHEMLKTCWNYHAFSSYWYCPLTWAMPAISTKLLSLIWTGNQSVAWLCCSLIKTHIKPSRWLLYPKLPFQL